MHRSEDCTEEFDITSSELGNILRKIDASKASGPDGIPGSLLKVGAYQLSEPLAILFNKSLINGELPKDWASANPCCWCVSSGIWGHAPTENLRF